MGATSKFLPSKYGTIRMDVDRARIPPATSMPRWLKAIRSQLAEPNRLALPLPAHVLNVGDAVPPEVPNPPSFYSEVRRIYTDSVFTSLDDFHPLAPWIKDAYVHLPDVLRVGYLTQGRLAVRVRRNPSSRAEIGEALRRDWRRIFAPRRYIDDWRYKIRISRLDGATRRWMDWLLGPTGEEDEADVMDTSST